MPFDIVGLGYCSVDYLGIVAKYPKLDTKVQLEELSVQGGGVAATAMVTAARLGATTSYVGIMGGDVFGDFMLGELEREGVDTSRVVRRPGAVSPLSFIVIDRRTGKRNIFWSRCGIAPLSPGEIDRAHVTSCKVLHLDNHEPEAAIQAATWANEAGKPVLLDAGSVRPSTPELLEGVNVLITSSHFAQDYTGQSDPLSAARAMLGGRTEVSVVTLGEHGCVCATREGSFSIPAFEVEVVDTTGAGDVFHGAFSFGLVHCWPIEATVRFASAVAAIKCTKLGGRQGIPTLAEAASFLTARGFRLPSGCGM